MKILVLCPFATEGKMAEFNRLFLPSDVDVVELKEGPSPGGGRSSVVYGLASVVEAIKDAEKQGYDAVVQACHADPGIQEARELVSIPVVGPANVAMHIATMLGNKVCMLNLNYPRWLPWNLGNIKAYGFESCIVQRGLKATVEDSFKAYEEYRASGGKITPFINDLVALCVKSIEEDNADVISFFCGWLIWADKVIQSELARKGYDVPVVNPLPTAVEIARALVNLKLTHSRLAYPMNAVYGNIKK